MEVKEWRWKLLLGKSGNALEFTATTFVAMSIAMLSDNAERLYRQSNKQWNRYPIID